MIALDAMGGDFFPEIPVQAAVKCAKDYKIPVLLVGREDLLKQELEKHDYDKNLIKIFHCNNRIGMGDSVMDALRKKDSSLHQAFELHKAGEVEGVVSAGNSGAVLAIGKYILKLIAGIDRPCISATMPHVKGKFVFLDVGANINCSAKDLLQFSILGSIYAQEFLEITNPRVALLNIGGEKGKGNSLLKESYQLLEQSSLNFIGNIEGKEIFLGKTDVVVADGILGNTFLKAAEGGVLLFQHTIKSQLSSSWRGKLGALWLKKDFQAIRKKIDYAEYGGAPLLGLNGVAIVCHGSSRDDAIVFAMRYAKWAADCHYVEKVRFKINEVK
jgi:glycerol-3-phosphate acyltransferase PlsX